MSGRVSGGWWLLGYCMYMNVGFFYGFDIGISSFHFGFLWF